MLLGFIILLGMVFLQLNKDQKGGSRVGIMKAAQRYIQVVSLITSFPLGWPDNLSESFGFANTIFSGSMEILSTECITGGGYAWKIVPLLFVPFL